MTKVTSSAPLVSLRRSFNSAGVVPTIGVTTAPRPAAYPLISAGSRPSTMTPAPLRWTVSGVAALSGSSGRAAGATRRAHASPTHSTRAASNVMRPTCGVSTTYFNPSKDLSSPFTSRPPPLTRSVTSEASAIPAAQAAIRLMDSAWAIMRPPRQAEPIVSFNATG